MNPTAQTSETRNRENEEWYSQFRGGLESTRVSKEFSSHG